PSCVMHQRRSAPTCPSDSPVSRATSVFVRVIHSAYTARRRSGVGGICDSSAASGARIKRTPSLLAEQIRASPCLTVRVTLAGHGTPTAAHLLTALPAPLACSVVCFLSLCLCARSS